MIDLPTTSSRFRSVSFFITAFFGEIFYPLSGDTFPRGRGGGAKNTDVGVPRQVLKAGTPEHSGTPEHRNTPEHQNTEFDAVVLFPITDHVKNLQMTTGPGSEPGSHWWGYVIVILRNFQIVE